jgi:hypothetical protein
MSYTILTIPFNLKEKEQGEFLKKGFVIDDTIYGEKLSSTDKLQGISHHSFLHVSEFGNEDIKKAAIKALVKENLFSKDQKVYFLGTLTNENEAVGLIIKYGGKKLDKKIEREREKEKETVSHIKNTIVVLGNNPDGSLKSILEDVNKKNIILSESDLFQLFDLLEKLSSDRIDLKKDKSFFDKKYQKQVNGIAKGLSVGDHETKKWEKENVADAGSTGNLNPIWNRFQNNIEFNIKLDNEKINIPFHIEKIEFIVNRQNITSKAVGFGFLKITLSWIPKEISGECDPNDKDGLPGDYYTNTKTKRCFGPKRDDNWPELEKNIKFDKENDVISFIEKISPIAEFFRYFGLNKKNRFNIFSDQKTDFESVMMEILNSDSKYAFLKEHEYNIKKVDFKALTDELLLGVFDGEDLNNIFDFGLSDDVKILKPYILHLSNIKIDNALPPNYDIDNQIFKLIRIPGRDNSVVNKDFNNETFISKPDESIKHYVLNEGAFIIEGVDDINTLLKKYYPAFLLALNQKYLFHYIQEKINELPWDQSINQYKPDDLKVLQETMIFAEFSQIFTSISNYNEIDLFFEKLREQFKIEELKKEYLASIEGISKITQINEDDKKELREKLNSSRLNLILVLLTIAQVWPDLYRLYFENDLKFKIGINDSFYPILLCLGLYFYFIHFPIKSKSKEITFQNIKEQLLILFTSPQTSHSHS